ncbi:MAG: hypothetical protein SCARUB_01962 [Candidatus Scalindua rubra]|uniref:Uncharacterized protein n=1 Tax=Candidatus Scalindua rubra TaxID=1872076 RepID=A0A1E3XBD0_9BACT|nr:MAG: hypothetical protein SCARUB_01962 [Candidatus Scalindua rubra]
MPIWGIIWLIVLTVLLLVHIYMDMREIGKLKEEIEKKS